MVNNAGILFVEVEKDLTQLQQCGAMAQIKEEALQSLVGGLNSKKLQLAKRAGKDKSAEALAIINSIIRRRWPSSPSATLSRRRWRSTRNGLAKPLPAFWRRCTQ